jgi:hypothetical protein
MVMVLDEKYTELLATAAGVCKQVTSKTLKKAELRVRTFNLLDVIGNNS